MQAYCLKCRAHREIQDPREVILKNGRKSVRGTCSVCGGNVSRIASLKSEAVA